MRNEETDRELRIGFLGLGVMGLPMVANIIKKTGKAVSGFDVSKERLKLFEEIGGDPVNNVEKYIKNVM